MSLTVLNFLNALITEKPVVHTDLVPFCHCFTLSVLTLA